MLLVPLKQRCIANQSQASQIANVLNLPANAGPLR